MSDNGKIINFTDRMLQKDGVSDADLDTMKKFSESVMSYIERKLVLMVGTVKSDVFTETLYRFPDKKHHELILQFIVSDCIRIIATKPQLLEMVGDIQFIYNIDRLISDHIKEIMDNLDEFVNKMTEL